MKIDGKACPGQTKSLTASLTAGQTVEVPCKLSGSLIEVDNSKAQSALSICDLKVYGFLGGSVSRWVDWGSVKGATSEQSSTDSTGYPALALHSVRVLGGVVLMGDRPMSAPWNAAVLMGDRPMSAPWNAAVLMGDRPMSAPWNAAVLELRFGLQSRSPSSSPRFLEISGGAWRLFRNQWYPKR